MCYLPFMHKHKYNDSVCVHTCFMIGHCYQNTSNYFPPLNDCNADVVECGIFCRFVVFAGNSQVEKPV